MEKWKIKSVFSKALQIIPLGDRLYYFIQKNITKSVWVNNESFKRYFVDKVIKHLTQINKHGKISLETAAFFEFGAGWDLLAPIGICLVGGVKRYVTVDINAYIRPELIKNTLKLYAENEEYIYKVCEENGIAVSDSMQRVRVLLNGFDERNLFNYIKDNLGIEYMTQSDAGHTLFEDGKFDYIITNVTLEHIPREAINSIFAECRRILKSNGMMSHTIDCQDHYSYYDKSITVYNYLQFSNKEWQKYNTAGHFQNRLRTNDYRQLFEENGFSCIEVLYKNPTEDDRRALNTIQIADEYKEYSEDDLLIRSVHFVAKKTNT